MRTITMKGNTMTKTLKYENTANIGDTIRGYDFARLGYNDSYIEGLVVDKGQCDDKYYACYKIKLTKRLVSGEDRTQSTIDAGADIWYVPFETNDDTWNVSTDIKKIERVTKVKEAA